MWPAPYIAAGTNFDPLLGLAIATLRGDWETWRNYRRAAFDSTYFLPGKVEHVHGWLDPGGRSGGDLVLTEGDYFELARNANHPANKRLRLLFANPGAALVVGMSLADVNIRRLLYLLSKKPLTKNSAVYLVVKQRDPLIDRYTQEYWSERKLHLLFVEEYEELPGLLRDIQWGPPSPGELPGWVEHSLEWIENHCPAEMFFDADWQELAHGQTLFRATVLESRPGQGAGTCWDCVLTRARKAKFIRR
jgi:SIR2-like domain